MSPGRGSTPRRTDRLTVGRNGTLTLTLTKKYEEEVSNNCRVKGVRGSYGVIVSQGVSYGVGLSNKRISDT
jgi:hypothetical protein